MQLELTMVNSCFLDDSVKPSTSRQSNIQGLVFDQDMGYINTSFYKVWYLIKTYMRLSIRFGT